MKKWNTKTVAMLGVLVALHIVASRFLAINVTPSLRFSFSSSFVMLAGIWFGPVSGVLVGALADLLGCVIGGYAPFLPLTVTPALIGLLSGLLAPVFRRTKNILVYGALIVGITFLTTFLYGTWAQTLLQGVAYWTLAGPRALQAVCAAVLNTLIVYALYRSPVTRMIYDGEK